MTIVYTYGYEHRDSTQKGLKTRPYSMDMNKDIATLPKKGLKTRPCNIGMEKKGLEKYDYNIDMEKKDLKKLTKGQLIKLLLKKFNIHEDLLDNDPFKDEVTQEPTKPSPPPRTGKWESVSCKSVNEDGTSLFQNQGLTDHLK